MTAKGGGQSLPRTGCTPTGKGVGPLIAFIVAASIIEGIDTSIVNTVLPRMSSDLGMGVSYSSMVTIAYVAPIAALLLPLAKTADRTGIRRMFVAGTAVFLIGSLGCVASWSGEALIASRLVQGVGAAMMVSTTPLMVVRLLPETYHGRGMGSIAAGNGLAAIVGPPAGGLIADLLSWEWIFLINIPICLGLLAASGRLLPRDEPRPVRAPDALSSALLVAGVSVAMASLYLYVDLHPHWTWLLAAAAVSAGLVALAFNRSAGSDAPLLDPGLFGSRRFIAVTVVFLLSTMMGAGTMYLLPYYLDVEEGMGSAAVGLMMAVASVVTVAATIPTGRWCDRRGCYAPAALALGLRVMFSLMFAAMDPSLGMAFLVFAMISMGLSFGISGTSQSARMIEDAPPRFAAEAGSMAMLVNYVGYALGVAVCALVFLTVTGDSDPGAVGSSLFLDGFHAACLVCAAIAVVALAVSLAVRPITVKDATDRCRRMGRKAVICECSSSGINLIDDALALGLDPVAAFPPLPGGSGFLAAEVRGSPEDLADRAEVLMPRDLDDLLGMLSGMDVACVLAGSEYGIRYADMLSDRLGLPGNDPSTTGDRTEKLLMHRALERAGLRCIRTAEITCEEDIAGFWRGGPAVLKPSSSGGTVGLHLCSTPEDCVEGWRAVSSSKGWTGGDPGPVILQDYVSGTEYIVNTLSRDGVHRITDMWEYRKENVGDGIAYDCAMSVQEPGVDEGSVASYALSALDALGVRNGPAHLEIKLDDRGPVLIEINARPMGGHFSRDGLDETLGHHITDLALRSALDPSFISSLPEGIPAMGPMVLKVLMLHEDTVVDTAPLRALLKGVRSFRRLHCDIPPGVPTPMPMTQDLVASPGSVELMHPDRRVVMEDLAMLSTVEASMPALLYGGRRPVPEGRTPRTDVPEGSALLDDAGLHVPEDGAVGLTVAAPTMALDRMYEGLAAGIAALPPRGWVRVDPVTWEGLPYGRRGMATVLLMEGLEFDAMGDGPLTARRERRPGADGSPVRRGCAQSSTLTVGN